MASLSRLWRFPVRAACTSAAITSSAGSRPIAVNKLSISSSSSTPTASTGAPASASHVNNLSPARVLVSSVDGSINYIQRYSAGDSNEFLESRYVRRSPQYVSVYLSSHTGCRMGCKFCWLTAQGQRSFAHADINHYRQQMHLVLRDIPDPPEARRTIRVNINLMARGEALANRFIVRQYDDFFDAMHEVTVKQHGFGGGMRVNLSTIMPHTMRGRALASDVFRYRPVRLYYSLYSLQPLFRRKWMPNAMLPLQALDQLRQMQLDYEQQRADADIPQVNFHWAFIAGENDSESDVSQVLSAIKQRGFVNSKFNLVRFNPHPRLVAEGYHETEQPQLQHLFDMISAEMNDDDIDTQHSRIVPRAGPDVYASCGMFIDNADV